MLATMERYLSSPFSDGTVLDKIRDFVVQSHDVSVDIRAELVPFIEEDLDDGVKNLLMIGYLAGNAASQLRAGVKRSDAAAGTEGMLRVYLQLKAKSTTALKDDKVISPSLDAMLAERDKGPARAAKPIDDEAKQVAEGTALVKAGHPQQALELFDQVIASFQKRYATDKRHVYCARSQAETLLYLTQAASRGEQAVAIDPTWAEAWFAKSYALTELHRNAEAMTALDQALVLSPSNAHYLSERGYLDHDAKNWPHSLAMYKAAEENVKLISDQRLQNDEHARALRGQGYALVELGDLDGAEKTYQQSLAIDPNDKMSKQELEYIKGLRAKRTP